MKTRENRRFSVPRKFYKFSWEIVLLLVLLLFIVSCKETPKEITLSELQVEACNIADEAGSCNTRLEELGIVLKEECCNILGKCC